MVMVVIERWCKDKPYRTCAVNYEIGDSGTPHMHMVLEDPSKARFSAVQKLFPGVHIERTMGSKEQAEDYILKRGRFAEKEHTVVVPAVFRGQIKANQGKRNDLEIVQEMIEQGMKLNEILDTNIHYLEKESTIRKAYFRYHRKQMSRERHVNVVWHVGASRSGKTYTKYDLYDKYGRDDVYTVTTYKHPFDLYDGQKVLFLDEFRGGIPYGLLMQYLDDYCDTQIECRYANTYALWDEVHFATIYPPELTYKEMVDKNQDIDTYEQLKRRIDTVVYHWRDENGFHKYEISGDKYEGYEYLKQLALGDKDGFVKVPDNEPSFGDI